MRRIVAIVCCLSVESWVKKPKQSYLAPISVVGGGSEENLNDDEIQISFETCTSADEVLRIARRDIKALRNAADAWLRITYASLDDAELACDALSRLSELVLENEDVLEDRIFAQLLESIECRAEELGARRASECAIALSRLKRRGPQGLLEALTAGASHEIRESKDARLAADASRAFGQANAVFPELRIAEDLRAAVAEALLEDSESGATVLAENMSLADIASLAASLAGSVIRPDDGIAFSENDQSSKEANLVRNLIDTMADQTETLLKKETTIDASVLADVSASLTMVGSSSETLWRNAATAAISIREDAAKLPEITAKLSWALARNDQFPESRRLLDRFLDNYFSHTENYLQDLETESLLRLASALAASLPNSVRAATFFQKWLLTECVQRLGALDWPRRSRLAWCAATFHNSIDDNDIQDAAHMYEHYHWALGTLIASLEAEDNRDIVLHVPGAACRAVWAAVILGAPLASLSHHADAACAAALQAGRRGPTHLKDLLRAVWAIAVVKQHQGRHRGAFELAAPTSNRVSGRPVATLALLRMRDPDSMELPVSDRARGIVSAAVLGVSDAKVAISQADVDALASKPCDAAALLEACAHYVPVANLDPAAIHAETKVITPSNVDTADTSDANTSSDSAFPTLCAAAKNELLNCREVLALLRAFAFSPVPLDAKLCEALDARGATLVAETDRSRGLEAAAIATAAADCARLAQHLPGCAFPKLGRALSDSVDTAFDSRPRPADILHLARAKGALEDLAAAHTVHNKKDAFPRPAQVFDRLLKTVFPGVYNRVSTSATHTETQPEPDEIGPTGSEELTQVLSVDGHVPPLTKTEVPLVSGVTTAATGVATT